VTDNSLPKLLLVAHGSRSRSWVQAVHGLVAQMADVAADGGTFGTVGGAFLENAEPSIPAALSDLDADADDVEALVLPLFLTRSGHLREDVPEEVAGRARILPPLDPSRWLTDNLMRRLQRQTDAAPSRSGVVLVAYGSGPFRNQWDAMLQRTCQVLKDRGVADAAFAYVGHLVGMSPEPTAQALRIVAQRTPGLERLHVLPVLFGIGMLQTGPITEAVASAREGLGLEICYSTDAILPDPELARALVEHATGLTRD